MTSLVYQKIIQQVDKLNLDEQLDLMIYLANKTNKTNNNKGINNDLIIQNPEILGGIPSIKGTRISVELVLENLASGQSKEQLLYSYPSLSLEGIEGAISYAKSLNEDHYLRKLFEEYCEISSR